MLARPPIRLIGYDLSEAVDGDDAEGRQKQTEVFEPGESFVFAPWGETNAMDQAIALLGAKLV